MSSDQKDGAFYIGLSGVDRAKLSACIQLAAQIKADKAAAEKPVAADKPVKVSLKHDGNITQLSNGMESSYFGWVGKDVIVVSLHEEDRASLVKWMGGKGALARSSLGKSLAKTNTAATLWGAGEETKELEAGVSAKGGYGALRFSKGTLDADVHAVMENAAQATKMATSVTKQVDEARQGGQLPPMFVAMLKSVTIAAVSDEVVLKANVAEKDLMQLVGMAIAGIGGP
jgi:hypothetical protein